MINVLGLLPITGNGGIASWTKKFLETYPNDDYNIIPVNVSPDDKTISRENKFYRYISGLKALIRIYKECYKVIQENDITIMHTTTSGSIGTLRDYIINRLCHKYKIKTIMHCRYGCIPEDFVKNGFWGWLLRKTMHEYDQVWVLDSRSEAALKKDPLMTNKVYLTPNSIEVPSECDLSPRSYKRIAFVGNLIPTKGLYEIVEACTKIDVRLDIVGPGTPEVVNHIKSIAGDKLNNSIYIHGRLPNEQAVSFMCDVDIIALPTYYSSEGFPISILEAMSRGKMVISCPRAAIKDMLTAVDGTQCGILVREKSVDDIVDAIKWCQENTEEADKMCKKAYEKVYTCYRTDVIYKLYKSLYDKL